MIGRVLAFVACVALVSGAHSVYPEECNTNSLLVNGCCPGGTYASQIKGIGHTSFPPADLDETLSGFGSAAGTFDIVVNMHQAYWKASSMLTGITDGGDYAINLPQIEIACMGPSNGSTCPAASARKPSGSSTTWKTPGTAEQIAESGLVTGYESSHCNGRLKRSFAFSQVSGSAGSPSWTDDSSASTFTKVYAAVNVVGAAKVITEIHNSVVERLSIETIQFYFKFDKRVPVETSTTATYAEVQINVVLTQSSVSPMGGLTSFINLVDEVGVACTAPNSTAGTNYCGVNPKVKLVIGITTITNRPFMTVLRMDKDIVGTTSGIPNQLGIQISDRDLKSGLRFDTSITTGDSGSTQRTGTGHTPGSVPSGCSGSCAEGTTGGVSNCLGSCALSYKAYLVYQNDKTAGTNVNGPAGQTYTVGEENGDSDDCHIQGAILNIGNNGNGLADTDTVPPSDSVTTGHTATNNQEIQCRKQVSNTYASDPPCPFDPTGVDNSDDAGRLDGSSNIGLTIRITTSHWCPAIIADNQVVGTMSTTHESYFDGNQLTMTVRVQSTASAPVTNANGDVTTAAQTNLNIDKVAWHSLRGSCADTTGVDCNLARGGNTHSTASDASVWIISYSGGPAILDLDQTKDDETCNKNNVDTATMGTNPDNNIAWQCMIQATVYLCQHAPRNSANNPSCPESGTSAFEIGESATSTKIIMTGVLKVGYPSVAISRKNEKTVELKAGVQKMYALLQHSSGQADAEAEAFIQRAPVDQVENVDQVGTETQNGAIEEQVAVEEESNPMLIYIIVGVFLFISVFVGALVMYLRRSKAEKKAADPVPITVEVNKNSASTV